MIEKNEMPLDGQLAASEQETGSAPPTTGKKKFDEPEISSPISVLDATTFFMQFATGVSP